MTMLEKAAHAAAMGYGGKFVVVGGPMGPGAHSRAALAGYGKFGDASERYADDHWQDFVPAVKFLLSAIRVDMNLMIRVGREIGETPATVDLCWTRCIDAILEG